MVPFRILVRLIRVIWVQNVDRHEHRVVHTF